MVKYLTIFKRIIDLMNREGVQKISALLQEFKTSHRVVFLFLISFLNWYT